MNKSHQQYSYNQHDLYKMNQILQHKEDLPIKSKGLIFLLEKQIVYLLNQCSVLIITAETGSGKTTRKDQQQEIPQILLYGRYSSKQKKIGVILPRRIACVSISKRVQQQLQCQQGVVAYNIRFQNTSKSNTKIKFITDGMILREMMNDTLLEQYSIIMVDDIHQRSLQTDILLGFLKIILSKRKDFKVIISSAFLNASQMKNYFESQKLICRVLNVEGRKYKIEIYNLRQPCKNYLLKAVQVTLRLHKQKPKGDILVFVTGQHQVQIFINLIMNYWETKIQSFQFTMLCLPLYSGLPFQQQKKIFDPVSLSTRKIIISTNIAESSITIDGIVYVVDTGFHKLRQYYIDKNVQSLVVTKISKSNATQRAGRCGRSRQGQCYRLYTQNDFNKFEQFQIPQICRVNLMDYLLIIKTLGVTSIFDFKLFTQPSQGNLVKAIQQLYALGIINKNFQLNQIGEYIAQLPFQTNVSVMILNSFKEMYGCSQQILILAAMLAVQNKIFKKVEPLSILKAKKKIGAKQGDFFTMINIFLKYSRSKKGQKKKMSVQLKLNQHALDNAVKIHQKLKQSIKLFRRKQNNKHLGKKLLFENNSTNSDPQPIMRCILSGFFINLAQLQSDGSYKNISNKQSLHLHSTSILSLNPPQWIIYYQAIKSQNRYQIRNASQILIDWVFYSNKLFQIAGHYYVDTRKNDLYQNHRFQIHNQNKVQRKPDKGFDVQKKINKIQIGSKSESVKKSSQFNTSVLGLKQKPKFNTLSFNQQDI